MVTRPRHVSCESAPDAQLKVNLLIVDDDATKRFALKTILTPLDENVIEASSGADALRKLLRDEFAVVLLDVRMPIMDGFETAQLIRQRPRSELTPIIFVTALDQAETDMGRGYDLGAVDFVFAPVVPAIVRAKVSVFVELYRAQQELRRYRSQLEVLVEERTTALTAINRELEAFSYSVSHDLRAPLVALDGLSHALLSDYRGQLDDRAKDYLRRMREASQRLASVFDGLETLFRLTSGEIHREELDLSALAKEIVVGATQWERGFPVETQTRLAKLYQARQTLLQPDPTKGETAKGAAWSKPVKVGKASVRVFLRSVGSPLSPLPDPTRRR